jgi:hypothetical protein
MKLVPLRGKYGKGKYTKVDDDDYDSIVKTKWQLSVWPDGRYYVCGWRNRRHTKLHRFVTNAPPRQYIDHKNHDTLDNRKCNLRFCTNQQNQYNSRNTKGRVLSKGVYKTHNKTNPYRAVYMYLGKTKNLGYFKTPKEAQDKYIEAVSNVAGEFVSRG